MNRKRYRRYFIILDYEDKGFDSKGGKKPKGYTKIETKNGKGVLNHYIQNVKYFDNAEYVYKGYLIGTKEGKEICAENGTFIIDKNGNGELNWRFDAENVDGKGNSIRDFNVIAIVAKPIDETSIGKDMAAPLVGFIDKERVAWKHVMVNQYKEEKRKGKIQEAVEMTGKSHEEIKDMENIQQDSKEIKENESMKMSDVDKEEKVSETKEEKIECLNIEEGRLESVVEKLEKAKKEEQVQKEEKKEIEENKSEIKEAVKQQKSEKKEEVQQEKSEIKAQAMTEKKQYEEKEKFKKGYISKQEKRHDDLEYGAMKGYDCKNPYEYQQQYFKMVYGYIENILKYYKEVKPFEKGMENCKWWKIDCSQQTLYRNCLPFYGYINNMHGYMLYKNYMTGCPHLIYKYQHYIFGIICDKNDMPIYYLYGIPGRYMVSEQPYEGMTGFVYWHPMEDKKGEKGDYGYWILHIDVKTGNVAMPRKPTIPPR